MGVELGVTEREKQRFYGRQQQEFQEHLLERKHSQPHQPLSHQFKPPKSKPQQQHLPLWSQVVMNATMRVPLTNINFLSWLNYTFHTHTHTHAYQCVIGCNTMSSSWDVPTSRNRHKMTYQQKFVLLYRAFNSFYRSQTPRSRDVADSLADLKRADVFVPRDHAILMHRRAYKFTSGGKVGRCYADFTFPNRFGGELLKRMNKICDYKSFMGKEDPIAPPFQLLDTFHLHSQNKEQ
uniref:Uncharacterized protein n=1 Tax=Paramoeba aestuarina TaxID=180227 RepID=A0A7S4JMX3_9EUKA